MATWHCVKNCGACCHLDPNERPELPDYLTPAELALYQSLIGSDGWCIHFDHTTRECQIYDERPDFCRVRADTFARMFGIEPAELNDFAIACCREQIEGVYGERSLESIRFEQAIGLTL
jgi:hypothetical protein